jgi:hypothetical protein
MAIKHIDFSMIKKEAMIDFRVPFAILSRKRALSGTLSICAEKETEGKDFAPDEIHIYYRWCFIFAWQRPRSRLYRGFAGEQRS